ncbi:MAG: hypothetical protein ACI8P9_000078 [Parasphingorhabdus sp.]|jgi:hypothetical protein
MSEVVKTPPRDAMADRFLGWQCLVRQYCVRQFAGKPLPGMRPTISVTGHDTGAELNVIMVRADPAHLIEQFKHMVRSIPDPNQRYDKAVEFFSATYYQKAKEFSDLLTALFPIDSVWADRLIAGDSCDMRFEQANQSYHVVCNAVELTEDNEAFQLTYWHNYLFNEKLPGKVRILGFQPDWSKSSGGESQNTGAGRV